MLTLPKQKTATFSLDAPMLETILQHAKPLGHHEDRGNLNIGFGFLYYGLVRTLRPAHVIVIGSGFGFSVVTLALGLNDNGAGMLSFVDPSYSLLQERPAADGGRHVAVGRARRRCARISRASAWKTASSTSR